MRTDLDIIGSIEAAYATEGTDEQWLERLAHCVSPAFGAGVAPVTAFSFDVKERVYMGTFASVGAPGFTRQQFESMQRTATPAELRAAYECDMFTLLSRVVGKDRTSTSVENGRMGPLDPLGLRANVTPHSGIVVTTVVPHGFRIRQRALWVRLAAHIGAGLRLRQVRNAGPSDAAAVLTPDGRLEHANPSTEAARVDLADAAKAMDRARGKLRRLDPEEASSLWRAMVCGEWSLADWFDHDGKRFVVAHDNRVASAAPAALTSREQQVAACAAMGHSNKLIAYDLGLSQGTVSVLLHRAARKLGVSSRTALIRALRDLAEAPRERDLSR
jgi:DNA-binding CsgD family transcriptional regulator